MIHHEPPGRPVVESTRRVCAYHQKHPHDRSWPGCTCSGSVSIRYEVESERPVDPDERRGG